MTEEHCPVHPHVVMQKFCAACRGTVGGKSTTSYKRDAGRENIAKATEVGKAKGTIGWPKGKKRGPRAKINHEEAP
jgi:hypothetical protein